MSIVQLILTIVLVMVLLSVVGYGGAAWGIGYYPLGGLVGFLVLILVVVLIVRLIRSNGGGDGLL